MLCVTVTVSNKTLESIVQHIDIRHAKCAYSALISIGTLCTLLFLPLVQVIGSVLWLLLDLHEQLHDHCSTPASESKIIVQLLCQESVSKNSIYKLIWFRPENEKILKIKTSSLREFKLTTRQTTPPEPSDWLTMMAQKESNIQVNQSKSCTFFHKFLKYIFISYHK